MDYETLLYVGIFIACISYSVKVFTMIVMEHEEFKWMKKNTKPLMKYLKRFYKQIGELEG